MKHQRRKRAANRMNQLSVSLPAATRERIDALAATGGYAAGTIARWAIEKGLAGVAADLRKEAARKPDAGKSE